MQKLPRLSGKEVVKNHHSKTDGMTLWLYHCEWFLSMLRIPLVNTHVVFRHIKALSQVGFKSVRQRGSHVILVKETPEGKKSTVVPLHHKNPPKASYSTLKHWEMRDISGVPEKRNFSKHVEFERTLSRKNQRFLVLKIVIFAQEMHGISLCPRNRGFLWLRQVDF